MLNIEREILEQPAVIAGLIEQGTPIAQRIAQAIRASDPAFVLIAARGTSDNAGRYAQYLLGVHARLVVSLATPSIHTLYGAAPRLKNALVIGISQSGQSDDVRRVVRDGRGQGALTVAITNDAGSPLAQEAEHHLPLFAGPELSVAATKTYTAQLTALAMLAAELAADDEMRARLRAVPALASDTLDAAENIAAWVERYRYMERYAAIGRGYNYSTAFEISLKIKELCYVTGVEYSEADFRHGPIALVQGGFPVLLLAPEGPTLPRMLDLIAELGKRRAECLVISNAEAARASAHKFMPLPPGLPEWLSPLVAVLPGQVFALRLAQSMGHNVDQPAGLTKVTLTE